MPSSLGPAHRIAMDGEAGGRRFDGVGAISSGGSSRLLVDYPEPARSEILDLLFKPRYGASLQALKVEIGGDMDATIGAEPSHMRRPGEVEEGLGYEWWLMREAKVRNPNILLYGLAWGAPGWFDGGFWSEDHVAYIVSWLGCASRNGFQIDYIGGGNERGWDRDFYVLLKRQLHAHGYGHVQVVATDDHTPPNYWSIASAMRKDPELADAIDVVGEHDICGWRTLQRQCSITDDALALDKPLWDSENSTTDYQVGAEPLARAMSRHYIDAQVTANYNWAMIAAWYGTFPIGGTGLMLADRPWSGYYDVGKEIWVDAHMTQFTEPGWRYVDPANGYTAAGTSYSGLRCHSTGDYTLYVETMDLQHPETLQVDVTGGLSRERVSVWSTDLRSNMPETEFYVDEVIEPSDGSFEFTVKPGHVYTVSTTTGQRKGDVKPASSSSEQLQLPFRQDFEGLSPGELAPYFSDVHGGFQVARCGGGREGHCYRQMVTQEPIAWHGWSMPPTTIVGDPRWWGDYEVSVRALLEEPGYVALLGRVESQQHAVGGYQLRVHDSGEWLLLSQDVAGNESLLDSGHGVAVGCHQWFSLSLRFLHDLVTVTVNGDPIAEVRDDRHTVGQVGLRASPWVNAQFDDLEVVPSDQHPRFVRHDEMSVTGVTSEHTRNDRGAVFGAHLAIDDRVETAWRSEYEPLSPLPQSITLDLGAEREIHGLTYRPRITGVPEEAITGYRIETSRDGERFREVASGTWKDSIATKVAAWDAHRARFVRLEATDRGGEEDGCVSAADINIALTPMREFGAHR
ncbi:discoidin domain-containing protein [Georgenia deserti]|uniref:galactosylceramidase n=1 Tax=Georgenia deserti TaxID=2093781 RepID=A0ABW4KZD5_9MICO